MASNIQLTGELASAIPVATGAGKARLFRDVADGALKWKDHLGVIYPVASGPEDYHDAVRFATDAVLPAYTRVDNVITANANGALPSIDGVAPALTDDLLLQNGAAGEDNGIYTVTQLGDGANPFILERREDFAASDQVNPGCITTTGPEGTANGKQIFILATAAPITLNTTALTFEAIGGGGYTLVEDEGVPVTQRATMNFVGDGVTVTDTGGKTQVEVEGGGGYSLAEVTDDQTVPEKQDMLFENNVVVGDGGNLFIDGNATAVRTEDNFSIAYIPPRSRRVVQENDRMPYVEPLIVDGTLIVDGDIVDVTPYDGYDITTALELAYPGTTYIDANISTADATPTTLYSYSTLADNRIVALDFLIEAQSNDTSDVALFKVAAAFRRGAGATTVTNKDVNFVNGPYKDAGAAAWDVTFDIPGGGPIIDIQVTGDAAESIDWRVSGKAVEHG